MLKKIWGRKPKIQIGENADVTMWNTGVETPSAILCGLLATKLVAHKLNPVEADAPLNYIFDLKTSSQAKNAPKKIEVKFYKTKVNAVYVLDKNGARTYDDVEFTHNEYLVLFKAYEMLQKNAEKLHAAWKVEQNQNKALKLIEGLVE